MFAYYKTRGITILDKLNELFDEFGYCLNTLHTFLFEGSAGFTKMQEIMNKMREGIESIGPKKVENVFDYKNGLNGLPKSNVLKYILSDNCSVVVRPSGTEPKLKPYISVSARDRAEAEGIENEILENLRHHFE